ncbi:MAG: hypothetical protein HQ559_09960 [Lentisphaerae bacterium]|nr:hypothetical protein [Lentisphaerota bacterium]
MLKLRLAVLLVFWLSPAMNMNSAPARTTDTVEWPAYDIPRLPAITIDGDPADGAEWDKAFRVDLLVPVDTPLRAREEFSASARLGWNDAGLLVQVTVIGTVRNESKKLDELWKGDSVEIYLSPSADSEDRCRWVVAPGLDPRFPQPRFYLHDYRRTAALKTLPAGITAAIRRTGTGYQLEALLPWGALAIVPELNREVVCQIMVNNVVREKQPQDHLVWFPMYGAYSDSRKMCRVRLARTAQAPSIARGMGRVNLRDRRTEFEVLAPAALAGRTVRVGRLASGRLVADTNGYAHAQLTGLMTEAATVELAVGGRVADVIPLRLPSVVSPARRLTLETRLRDGGLTVPADCAVARRVPGQPWEKVAADAPRSKGQLYEYAVLGPGATPATDYFHAGDDVALADRRGTVVLIVEESKAEPLAKEIRRLLLDFVGDGWQVIRHDVATSQTPVEVKRLIQAQPADAVFLLGRVPVPYSGDLHPDGHVDHGGAWPADVFYGTGDEGWTDSSVNQTNPAIAVRQHNVPGDGKYDQSEIPCPVVRAVGRVDFQRLSVFGVDELTLLRRYLDRLHAYRQGQLPVEAHGWVQDNFFGHAERFAYSGWQNLTTLLGAENVADAEWPNMPAKMQLLFYGCGSGGPDHMAGFGSTKDLVKRPLNAVFALLFGSYFGDWDSSGNLMRGALASDGGALTCAWAGRPHWYLHPLGMGATIGECLKLTQNNGAGGYQPTGASPRGVHIALLGDPTLRMHRVMPPSDLRVRGSSRGVRLSWKASPEKVAGYHVYRADAECGPYERLTAVPVTARRLADPAGTPKHFYQVRAVARQESPTGRYFNSSQGLFALPELGKR